LGGKLALKIKLLALAIVVLLIVISLETFMLATQESSPVRVACVGDSITEGTGYTVELWRLLGSNYVVGDFGVGGATVSLNSGNSYLNSTAFQVAKDFQPHIVIVMLGTNDAQLNLNQTNQEFLSDYAPLVTEIKSFTSKPEAWIVKPPPVFPNDSDLDPEFYRQNVIPSISQVANQMNLRLIDVYTPLSSHQEYFLEDGGHPNVEGAQAIANIIFNALTS
jgi:lysophospholipase L1-like esterase